MIQTVNDGVPGQSTIAQGLEQTPVELTILMPCLNEAETLAICINQAREFLAKHRISGEVLIADNGSTDGSQEIARTLGARVVDVPLRGYGAAISHGSLAARGKYIIMGDSDASYDFSDLMGFVEALRAGHELVVGNRFKGGIKPGAMPWKNRWVGNPVLSTVGRWLFHGPIRDLHCGLRGYSKDAFRRMQLRTTGMEFASEMVIQATLMHMRVHEVSTTLSPDGRSRPPHLRPWRDGWRHLSFMLFHRPRRLFGLVGLLCLTATLFLLAGSRVTHGSAELLFNNSPGPGDLKWRWQEQRYVYHRQNPYDLLEREAAKFYHLPIPDCRRDVSVDPDIGPLFRGQGGYPPWAFLTQVLFILPTEYQTLRVYYAVLNALALVITFTWAYSIGRPYGRTGGMFLAAAALAIFGHRVAYLRGQNSIQINALLMVLYYLMTRHRKIMAGILYGLAAMKPQTSALFAIVFLINRQWRLLAAASAYVVAASLWVWWMTYTNPVEMIQQMINISRHWFDHGNSSLLHVFLKLGVDRGVATAGTAVLGIVSTTLLVWAWRKSSLLTLFAVAATIGRLWTYHGPYDNVMLVFLLVPLGKRFLQKPSLLSFAAFLLVGLPLWAPVIASAPPKYPLPFQLLQMSSWIGGLIILMLTEEGRNGVPTLERRTTAAPAKRDTELMALAH